MTMLLGTAWGILAISAVILAVRLHGVHKGLEELRSQLEDILSQDTNILLSLSTGDRKLRRFASRLNQQLRILRQQRQRYRNGDRELKEAVTNISHDLRTPLTAIWGYLELLDRLEHPPETARYLALIQNRVQALTSLTEELFRYSVILSQNEDLKLEPLCINGILEESIAGLYAALTERGILPSIAITEQKIIRRVNQAALSRVFGNVLSNALKYSGGDLSVTLSDSGDLRFANHAAGLSEVQVGRLFDRFFSVESAQNATGLGLAIARTLVERMNGTISASLSGQVLEIRITFPNNEKSSDGTFPPV